MLLGTLLGLCCWRPLYGRLCDPSLRSLKRVQADSAAAVARLDDEHDPSPWLTVRPVSTVTPLPATPPPEGLMRGREPTPQSAV
jgi:hypothetical protein